MSSSKSIVIAAGLLVLSFARPGLLASGDRVIVRQDPPAPVKPIDQQGAAALDKVCGACHETSIVTASHRTKAQWLDIVDDMVSKGAGPNDTEYAAIMGYLVRKYGNVEINYAPAEEIAAVLGLSDEEAAAIVAYRTKNGKFTDLAALTSVPNISQAKIDAAKAFVLFK